MAENRHRRDRRIARDHRGRHRDWDCFLATNLNRPAMTQRGPSMRFAGWPLYT